MSKTRLLYIGDHGKTGFGTVSYNLLSNLAATGRYEIFQMGINYLDLQPANVPWMIASAGFWHLVGNQWVCDDPYGLMKVQRYIEFFNPDITMLNNDYTIAEKYWKDETGEDSAFALHHSKKILYAPLDSAPCPPSFAKSMDRWDKIIMYSYWQRKEMAKVDSRFLQMPVVYHGINPEVFFPMDKMEAKEQLREIFLKHNPKSKLPDFTKKYIVYFNGTNQFRKDLPVLFRAFAKFHEDVSKAFLFPQTNSMPSDGGWYLPNLAGLTKVQDVMIMKMANVFSAEEVNIFLNAADVMAYPTRGEGFGLPHIEAFATKTPVIATDFGPQRELNEGGRGYSIKVRDLLAGINNSFSYFALPDWEDLAAQLNHVYLNPEEVAEVTERAYQWVQKHTWASKAQQIDKIIQSMLE